MKKILTLFTALAVMFVFAFLVSASPPTMASNAPVPEKNMKVLIVGESGVGQTAAALFAARDISVVTAQDPEEAPEIEALNEQSFYCKTIFVEEVSGDSESVPINYRNSNRQTTKTANYRQPAFGYFTGFDKPARGKI